MATISTNPSKLDKKMLFAQKVLKSIEKDMAKTPPRADFSLVQVHLDKLTNNIKQDIQSGVPLLTDVANYYFDLSGKHMRPAICLLVGLAAAHHQKVLNLQKQKNNIDNDDDIDNMDGLIDEFAELSSEFDSDCSEAQVVMAQVTEMIHTSSLLHDDVIDCATQRRGAPAVNVKFSNKMAVLAGDYLLGRASLALTRLRSHDVTFILSHVITNLVEGEFMQLERQKVENIISESNNDETFLSVDGPLFAHYLKKTYNKTASLICKSCQAVAILGNNNEEVTKICNDYGDHLGMAFQIVDDYLDFVGNTNTLGKEAGQDLKLGLATAPVLFALQDHAVELAPMIQRKFEKDGDVERTLELVKTSNALELTKQLGQKYADKAKAEISKLSPSPARTALIDLCDVVINRKH